MKKRLLASYQEIISLENLFAAWQEFLPGKKNKKDVQKFGFRLTDNILQLHEDLANFNYTHGPYKFFNISDPKPRNIHKACVRDRVLHHAIYRKLYPFFDKGFIADSYSCRMGKGVHKAIYRFVDFGRQVSKNNTRTVWVLKCDIKKFFANIDHKILLEVLASYISDKNILWLLGKIILSFPRKPESMFWIPGQVRNDSEGKGLPLGNLTSQLFCNVYMNEFDQFIKHKLKMKFYIRYADDFIFLSDNKNYLLSLLSRADRFLQSKLSLNLHPRKIVLKTFASGVDFLGWVSFSHCRILRTTTKIRMFKRILINPSDCTFQSYLGLMRHGNTQKNIQTAWNIYWLYSFKH